MNRVSRSESRFLLFVRALMVGGPRDQLEAQLKTTHLLPERLGPTAMRLVERTLAKGAILALARGGGWHHEIRPAGTPEAVVEGPLWRRHPEVELRFSTWSFAVLHWAWQGSLTERGSPPKEPTEPGLGDRLVALLLARAFVGVDLPFGIPAVLHEPLVGLFLAGRAVRPYRWSEWLDAGGDVLLEGLQDGLGASCAAREVEKMGMSDPEALLEASTRQRALLDPLLQELARRERLDLADFLLAAGQHLVPDPHQPPALEPHRLRANAPLRDRLAAREASAAFIDSVLWLEMQLQSARNTRFFEDTYDAAQARLTRWERFGPDRARVFREAGTALRRSI